MSIVSINILHESACDIVISNHSNSITIHKEFNILSHSNPTDWTVLKAVLVGWFELLKKTYCFRILD
jgi:hypothetical protein